MRRWPIWCLFVCLLAPAIVRADKRPMKFEDLAAFQRVADPQISPDGKHVAYQVTTVDLAGNKTSTNLWVAATDRMSPPRRLTTSTKADRHARWSPDGSRILFESTRSGDSQLWVIDLGGGEARQLTSISTGAWNGIWAPDGKTVAFVSAVYPENSDKPFAEADKLNKERDSNDLVVKIGIHEGPCLAVMLNERQDYFGQTVNIAARVQSLSTSQEIHITGPVIDAPAVAEILNRQAIKPIQKQAALRGIADKMLVYEIP